MKNIQDKVIIYDDNCPLCALYTKAFVKCGLLEPQNRLPFSKIEIGKYNKIIDFTRARHEIPLIDKSGQSTLYGVDAMVFILQQKLPFLNCLLTIPAAEYFFKKLYKFVSYNRKVIIPPPAQLSGFNCSPDFNLKYRLLFILFAIMAASGLTYAFGVALEQYFTIPDGGQAMLLIAGSGWVLQIILAVLFLPGPAKVTYTGHLGVLMLLGTFILLPAIALQNVITAPLLPLGCVLVSSLGMLWQHRKRAKHLQLSSTWTWLWFLNLQITALAWIYFLFLN